MELTRERSERAAAEATSLARGFLDRWRDPLTRAARDDCAQEAVLRAVQRLPGMRDPARFPALVRTIARRMRYRELLEQRRMRSRSMRRGRFCECWWIGCWCSGCLTQNSSARERRT